MRLVRVQRPGVAGLAVRPAGLVHLQPVDRERRPAIAIVAPIVIGTLYLPTVVRPAIQIRRVPARRSLRHPNSVPSRRRN